jgi:hypothetical protein
VFFASRFQALLGDSSRFGFIKENGAKSGLLVNTKENTALTCAKDLAMISHHQYFNSSIFQRVSKLIITNLRQITKSIVTSFYTMVKGFWPPG